MHDAVAVALETRSKIVGLLLPGAVTRTVRQRRSRPQRRRLVLLTGDASILRARFDRRIRIPVCPHDGRLGGVPRHGVGPFHGARQQLGHAVPSCVLPLPDVLPQPESV